MVAVVVRRAGLACAAFFMVLTGSAVAEDEILMRQSMAFNQCPSAIEGILRSMHARGDAVEVTRDTGAHYAVKLKSVDANLLFMCNAVSQQIEIARQTPGDYVDQNATASAN